MIVIFLDIDGVLNSTDYMNSVYIHRRTVPTVKTMDKFGHHFDPRCVNWLQCILDLADDIKIVISSSWRFSGLSVMQEMWKERELPGEVIDITHTYSNHDNSVDDFPGGSRGAEIQYWLDKHDPVDNYFIIDDDVFDLSTEQHSHFIHTTNRYGLSRDSYIKAKEILNIK